MALTDLRQYGQSVWYDYMSRRLLASGELLRMIARDGLGGVTSNTTLFSPADYEAAAKAYIDGLLDRPARGLDLKKIASVASVFVSRIDTAVDKALDQLIAAARDVETKQRLEALKGKAAIANAKV